MLKIVDTIAYFGVEMVVWGADGRYNAITEIGLLI